MFFRTPISMQSIDLICSELYFSKTKKHKSNFYISQQICQTYPTGQDGKKNGMFQNSQNQQECIKSLLINNILKLASFSLWSYLFWMLLKCSPIDLYFTKMWLIKLQDYSEHFSTKKYKPMYLIRCEPFKRLTLLSSSQLWDCLIQTRKGRRGNSGQVQGKQMAGTHGAHARITLLAITHDFQ